MRPKLSPPQTPGREALLRVRFVQATQRHVRLNEPRQIEQGSPRVFRLEIGARDEQVAAAGNVGEARETHLGELLPHLLGHRGEVSLGVLGMPLEDLGAAGDAGRAVRDVARLADDAAHRHHERLTEAELVGPKEGVLDHVGPVLDPAANAELHRLAQSVHDERLMRLRETHFARQPGVLLARHHRRAGAAVDAVDLDDVRAGLGHAHGDCADVLDRDELHRDLHARLGGLEVEDELRQVLDGIDVVVGRRGDQVRSRLGKSNLGDLGRHLPPHELPALAGLGTLGHLDRQFVRVDEVLGVHAEPTAGDLADAAAEAALLDYSAE